MERIVMKGWLPQIHNMYRYFERYDAQMEVLREVDQAMRNNVHPEGLILDVARKIEKMTHASTCYFAMSSGEYYWPIEDNDGDKSFPIGPIPNEIYESADIEDAPLRSIILSKTPYEFVGKTNPKSLLFVPVHSKEDSQTNLIMSVKAKVPSTLIGILVLESPLENPYGLPIDSGFLKTLAGQIANAFHFHKEFKVHRVMSEILVTFFDSGLKPSDCLRILAKKASSYLPNYGPFKFIEPEVQVLFYDGGLNGNDEQKNYLTIKATSEDKQWTIERVSVKESVCGTLVDNPLLEHYLCDPRQEQNYNWYLGKHENKEMKTELAIPLKFETKLIGVLNLETEQANAFKEIHIEAGKEFAKLIENWIYVIKNRIEKDMQRQDATTEAVENYIKSWMQAVAHDIKNDLNKITLRIDDAKKIMDSNGVAITGEAVIVSQDLLKAKNNCDALGNNVDSLVSDIVHISKRGANSINNLLRETVFVFEMANREDINKGVIQVCFDPIRDWDVYCSPGIKLHFYEFMQNSYYWLKTKSLSADNPGIITVNVREIDQDQGKKEAAKKLNTRVEVIIRDNGPGINANDLKKIQLLELGQTRRKENGGSGFGLFAAKEYLSTVKGWLSLDSSEGVFFEVKTVLEIYDSCSLPV